jgi:hypothetical protein
VSGRYISRVVSTRGAAFSHAVGFTLPFLVACLFVLAWVQVGWAAPYQEADVKAVLITRVVAFVRWSEDVAHPQPRPIVLTVLGDPTLADRLDALQRRDRDEPAQFLLKRIGSPDELKRTDVLFIGREQAARIEEILELLGASNTLTIADTPGAARRGVAVNLYPDDGRMRLEINPAALRKARLTASYQLMNLARVVGTGERP